MILYTTLFPVRIGDWRPTQPFVNSSCFLGLFVGLGVVEASKFRKDPYCRLCMVGLPQQLVFFYHPLELGSLVTRNRHTHGWNLDLTAWQPAGGARELGGCRFSSVGFCWVLF